MNRLAMKEWVLTDPLGRVLNIGWMNSIFARIENQELRRRGEQVRWIPREDHLSAFARFEPIIRR